jgi:hypothetical protein
MVEIGVGIRVRQFEICFQASEKKWKHVHALVKSILGNVSNFCYVFFMLNIKTLIISFLFGEIRLNIIRNCVLFHCAFHPLLGGNPKIH